MSVKGQESGIKHGTPGGYKQHIYREIPACGDCLEAIRQDGTKRYQAKRANPADRNAFRDERLRHLQSPSKARDVQHVAAGPRPDGTIPGRDLAVGDVIVFLATEHRIDRFESYTGSLLAELGAGTRIAYSGTWGMTIGPDAAIRILPRPEGGVR